MSAVLRGRAVVFSIGGVTMTAGIINASSPDFPQSLRFQRNSEKKEVMDTGGTIRTQIFHTFKKTLSLTVVPADIGPNQSAAFDSMDNHCITPGTKVTVVDASGAVIDGSYNLTSMTQNRSVDGVATVDLEMEQGDEGVDLTLAVS